jgi:chaperonin GroEL (HSP60 family)
VKNVLDDQSVVPGAGAFEVACAAHLRSETKKTVSGRAKLGIEAFAEALLGFPKILAENSGHDPQEAIIKMQVGGGGPTAESCWVMQVAGGGLMAELLGDAGMRRGSDC